jgi:hypothetical protein
MLYQAPKLLAKETDILDKGFRKKVIDEIMAGENKKRKQEAWARYEQYKDKTHLYVVEMLLKQFAPQTVAEMQYAISDVSIARKIVNKLAKVYDHGVERKVELVGKAGNVAEDAADPEEVDPNRKSVDDLAKKLKLNRALKKANRFLKLQKNGLIFTKPQKKQDGKFNIAVQVLSPFLYDVLPNPENNEEAMVVVLSHFTPVFKRYYDVVEPAVHGQQVTQTRGSDGQNQAIADVHEDEAGPAQGDFIWWSPNFHFTTDEKGEIKPNKDNPGNSNPLQELPFVELHDDQDGTYWADGGDDLCNGALQINALLTHLNHIAVLQGYGQLVGTGKNLPKQMQLGPNHAILGEYQEGEPEPKFQYISANPPIDEQLRLVEAQVALLLTTNNLSTSGVSLGLKGSSMGNFASGIALIIDKSESIEDTTEQAETFIDAEPLLWKKLFKWKAVLASSEVLSEELAAIADIPENARVTPHFPNAQPIISEGEHLDNLKKRQDLGLNTRAELIMKDNPGMTKEQAIAKLKEIDDEAKSRAAEMGLPQPGQNPAQGGVQGKDGKPGDQQNAQGQKGTPPAAGKDGQNEVADEGNGDQSQQ